jgi:hypothetical protein
MPLVILLHLLNVFVQLANKRGFTHKKKICEISPCVSDAVVGATVGPPTAGGLCTSWASLPVSRETSVAVPL